MAIGSGSASAVPDDLYSYSNTTSQAGNDLLTWVRTTLAPVVAEYQATAIDAGNEIANLTLPISVRQAHTVDLMSTQQVTAAVKTDQAVHDVGQAFQDAGNSGNSVIPPWVHNHLQPGQSPFQYATITTSDTTIDLELAEEQGDLKTEADIQAALDLANQVNQDGITDADLQELAAHKNDPEFCIAFFNNLDPAELTVLLKAWMLWSKGKNTYGDDVLTALLTALHTGDLSPAACDAIVDAMSTNGMGDWCTKFLTALGKDPAAEANFFTQLDDAHLMKLLNGEFGEAGGFGQWINQGPKEAQIIQMLTSVYKGLTPPIQELFYERIAGLIQQTSPSDAEAVLPAVENLLGAHIGLTVSPPPPGATPDQISAWARAVGTQVDGQANAWAKWMKQFEGQNNDNRNKWETGFEFAIGLVTTAIGIISTPVGVVAGVAGDVLTTWVVPLMAQAIDPLTGDPGADKDALAHNAYVATRALTIVYLFENGEIAGPDGKLLPLTKKTLDEVDANPNGYKLLGADKSVQDVLDNVRAQFAP